MTEKSPLIPVSLIRKHCKIEDFAGVDDSMLELYAEASLEALHDYTGRTFGPPRMVRETLKLPNWQNVVQGARARMIVWLQHPADDGSVTVEWLERSKMVNIKPGTRQIEWPWSLPRPMQGLAFPAPVYGVFNETYSIGGDVSEAPLPTAVYSTGTGEPFPPGALIGCLKYIAWLVQHPGDELVTILDRYARVSGQGAQGTNNAVLASGAYSEWRRYKRGTCR